MTHPMESGEEKAEQREQQPVSLPPKKRKKPKPEKSAQANGGGIISSSSAAESSSLTLSRTSSSSSPPSKDDADGNGGQQQQQQEQHEQGGGGRRPRLVWTAELHNLFVKAYDSLGDEAVPRRILEKMNIPEVSREKVASHLQKHKLHLKRLAEEASSQNSPTEEAPAASQPYLRSLLPPNTTPLAAEVSPAAQLEQVLQKTPPDCLSRSSSSTAANLQILKSIQQQLLGPPPIKEGPGDETMMHLSPIDSAGCSTVEGHGWGLQTKRCTGQHMETSTAAILVPEASTEEEAVLIRMAQAAKAENAAEAEEAAPAAGSILAQFWASPDNEASSTSSWDIFALGARNETQ